MAEAAAAISWLGWAVTVVVAALSGLLGVVAALLERSGPIRLRHWTEEAGGRLRAVYGSPPQLEAFRFLLSFLARITPLVLLGLLLAAVGFWAAAATVAVWLAVVELVSRLLVRRNPEASLRWMTRVYRVLLTLFWPLVVGLAPLLARGSLDRRDDEDEVSEDEIEAFLDVGTREGILEPGEEDLIQRVIDFGDAVVRSVVTPRIDIVSASVDSDLEALTDLFLDSKHSRIPLYRGSVDQVVGILHIRDLLAATLQTEPPPAESLCQPPYVVPATKPLNELLREFQKHRQQMAIVVDEYGGVAGLVTVEDLLEEIVGEIVDEHEQLEAERVPLPDGSWKLDGGTPLDTLSELFGAEVGDEPYETIGGFIFGRLGTVPEPHQSLEAFGLKLTVRRVDGRRIKSVVVQKSSRADGP